jgi:DHA1 family bicyclomycin/chloramphenicol resistance-like MFS transporter
MFILLFLLISFGSVCAVLFTPALPQIGLFFGVSPSAAQLTITLYLIGYAVGQLLYGPLANGYGRKKALYIGISLEIISALVCALSANLHMFWILVLARLFMALGASVGLKMSFTIVSDCYTQEESNRIISHLMTAFAITPGLGIALGGFLSEHFAWTTCFYFLMFYGIFLLYLVSRMKETAKSIDKSALKFSKIISKYLCMIKNARLILNGSLLGVAGSFIYLFAAVAPFLTATFKHLIPQTYGLWNLLPPLGIVLGSQLSAYFSGRFHPRQAIFLGVSLTAAGTAVILTAFMFNYLMPVLLFLPLMFIYMGTSFIFSNASMLAMSAVDDKASGSAMMNFISVGGCTLSVICIGFVPSASSLVLPIAYSVLVVLLFAIAISSKA